MSFDKAGQILQKLLSPANKDKGYTIKSLVLAEDVKEKKRVYGLVCESLKCKEEEAAEVVKSVSHLQLIHLSSSYRQTSH